MSALDAFRAAFGDWNSLKGSNEDMRAESRPTLRKHRPASVLTCLDCGLEWEHHELLRIKEPHGEVLLYCPGCQSGELDD